MLSRLAEGPEHCPGWFSALHESLTFQIKDMYLQEVDPQDPRLSAGGPVTAQHHWSPSDWGVMVLGPRRQPKVWRTKGRGAVTRLQSRRDAFADMLTGLASPRRLI